MHFVLFELSAWELAQIRQASQPGKDLLAQG